MSDQLRGPKPNSPSLLLLFAALSSAIAPHRQLLTFRQHAQIRGNNTSFFFPRREFFFPPDRKIRSTPATFASSWTRECSPPARNPLFRDPRPPNLYRQNQFPYFTPRSPSAANPPPNTNPIPSINLAETNASYKRVQTPKTSRPNESERFSRSPFQIHSRPAAPHALNTPSLSIALHVPFAYTTEIKHHFIEEDTMHNL